MVRDQRLELAAVLQKGPAFRRRWDRFALMFLAVWEIAFPWAAGDYGSVIFWNDLGVGVLIGTVALLPAFRDEVWPRWGLCVTGIWLLMAPLFFWTRSPAYFANDTFVGILIILFSVLTPQEVPIEGSGIPPGWTYNPSVWHHRAPIIVIGFAGFFIARYMAAFQMEHIPRVWDPFFGDGTKNVLTSDISRAFPVPDAGLGAVAYLLESLSGLLGDTRRWRTMPWTVLLFFFLVVPAGVVSIVLIVLQPVAVGAWCALCLLTALLTLITIPPAVDEVIAMGQFLLEEKRRGRPIGKLFWMGSQVQAAGERDIKEEAANASFGISFTVPLALCTAIGLWLMFAPAVFRTEGWAAHLHHLLGAMIMTFAVIATADAARMVRWINVLFGLGLLAYPWIFAQASAAARIQSLLAGACVIALSIPRGRVKDRFGAWDRYIV